MSNLFEPHGAVGWQGQQAFISYGQQSNDRLLQYYGFVEPRNSADTYVVTSMPQRLEVKLLAPDGPAGNRAVSAATCDTMQLRVLRLARS